MVETVENGQIQTLHAAGVGKIDRQSPSCRRVLDINFNPFWTVPASIIRKDLIPKMQANPNYLTENKIRIYNKDNVELQPSQVNWNSLEATNYRFRRTRAATSIRSAWCASTSPTPTACTCTTRRPRRFGDDYRFMSSGCTPCRMSATMSPGCSKRLAGIATRSTRRSRPASVSTPPLNRAVPVYWVT